MKINRFILLTLSLAIVGYLAIYVYLYSIKDEQSNRFIGQSIPADYQYSFSEDFEELNFQAKDGGVLNGVLFKADMPKGVICFWKGNGGTVKEWAEYAPLFLKLRYDILITDYRQQGKSKGKISLENFYSDAQLVYDTLKKRYTEDRIILAGFSLGGRIAAHVAAVNAPHITIMLDAASTTGDFSDRFLSALYAPFPPVVGFMFQTETDVQQSRSPVVVIGCVNTPKSLSHQLKPLLKDKDMFFEIEGATHGTILKHAKTRQIISDLLK